MYYVYILKSLIKNRHYIGYSADLKRRLIEHNSGKVKSTKAMKPWELIYYEAHQKECLARKTEIFYKTGQGRRQLKKKLEIK
ncbi:endonuclease [Candidatus Kuenenbacteria bacterium RIFCSPHIGHO2_02_FULL_39_13]|uniref:Endonuclease n=1 Tax=Candidatus Kuenenbacteria bacterium RIFCSPHIGHO2_02_FULL_39_13 TaxID=1798561 RepID=A0A1F6FLZ3_9BACT|nr:MAG: endonuclease [Candidatus Kuenenbacteria bacterium RIFCSPHIGHO2_02_FULL_39_13]